MNQLQRLMHIDKYARWLPEEGRRETWNETCERVTAFFRDHVQTYYPHAFSKIPWDVLHDDMVEMRAMPSMRVMQMAGPALKRDNLVAYNCAALPLQDFQAFGELLYILMGGTGCGFSVETRFVDKLPRIKKQKKPTTINYVIGDSTEGWCDALVAGMEIWANGEEVSFDYSQCRPAGTPLKTKGGRSSGPEPLKQLLDMVKQKVLSRQGSRLSPLDCHDIACMCGNIVQVGGVRRAAEISLSDLDDHELRDCKQGAFWNTAVYRSMSNNSAVYEEKPSCAEFMEEWTALMKSGTGERGIFNRGKVNSQIPKRRKKRDDWLVNPCLTGDTIIATVAGPKTFKELAEVGQDVLVYAWHPQTKVPVIRWMRRPHMTNPRAEILEIDFDSGLTVKCTPNHSFYTFRGQKCAAHNLKIGQSVRAWSLSEHRDGQLRVHGWDSDGNKANHQWVHRMLWENAYGPIPQGKVIHHKDGNPHNNVLDNLELVDPIEHNKIHYPERLEAGFFHGTPPKNHKIVAIRQAGYAAVYNGCVDDAHTYVIVDPEPVAGVLSGIVSANCGEIYLRPFGLCNLSIAVARAGDTEPALHHKLTSATIWGTLQSTLTNFNYVREQWKLNAEEERLLGVDITGQWDCAEMSTFGVEQFKQTVLAVNREYADILGIAHSAATTCVKPSGNSSQFLNTSSGIHPRFAPYYIRRLRIGAQTPVGRWLRESGIKWSPEVGQSADTMSVMVVDFPVATPEGCRTSKDVSALEMLNYWLYWKLCYTEHNPSVTIYVADDEWLEVGAWVWRNWDHIGGLSFLPKSDAVYQLAPYEEITKSQYEQLISAMPQLDFSKLQEYEQEDSTDLNREYACVGGSCEL